MKLRNNKENKKQNIPSGHSTHFRDSRELLKKKLLTFSNFCLASLITFKSSSFLLFVYDLDMLVAVMGLVFGSLLYKALRLLRPFVNRIN